MTAYFALNDCVNNYIGICAGLAGQGYFHRCGVSSNGAPHMRPTDQLSYATITAFGSHRDLRLITQPMDALLKK